MSLEEIRNALESRLEIAVQGVTLAAGGDINDAYRASTDHGELFIKTSARAQHGAFRDEAAGLQWLAVDGGVRVPEVIGFCDESDGVRLLALEWIERGSLTLRGEEELGRGLARVHLAGAPAFGATPSWGGGYRRSPMRFNELSLPNDSRSTWAEFYAENRLLPLAVASFERGSFDAAGVAQVERLCERLPDLAGDDEPPARTHGDLWSGNVLPAADGTPHLIDPVAHGGHREVDLALLSVFGGPGERCFAAYDELFPRADGHSEREPLWQLAMILLHVYLFGGGYAAQARQIIARYL